VAGILPATILQKRQSAPMLFALCFNAIYRTIIFLIAHFSHRFPTNPLALQVHLKYLVVLDRP